MVKNFNTHLYFIRDRLSCTPITSVIQSLNDLSACRGFKAFIDSTTKDCQEHNKPVINPLEYELIHICELDSDNRIVNFSDDDFTESSYRKVCSGDTVENLIDDLISKIDETEE